MVEGDAEFRASTGLEGTKTVQTLQGEERALHCTALHCTALHLHCIEREKEPSWAATCSNCIKCSRSVSCFPPRNHILEQQSVSQSGPAVKAVGALCQWQLSVAAVSGSSVTDGSIELSVGRQSCLVS